MSQTHIWNWGLELVAPPIGKSEPDAFKTQTKFGMITSDVQQSDRSLATWVPATIMSNKPDKSSFLRAESELILDLVSGSVREATDPRFTSDIRRRGKRKRRR
jgi:hypothetical protein